MKFLPLLALLMPLLAFGQLKSSGPAKVYKGPEGEKITVVEVDEGRSVVAKFEGVKGDLNGQTKLLEILTQRNGEQEYFYMKKKGSKQVQIPVMKGGKGHWQFLQPGVENWLSFKYSEEDSAKVTAEDFLKQYKP